MSRIIAGPSLTHNIAALGASVMKVSAEQLPDLSYFDPERGWGKWDTGKVDITTELGRKHLRDLILEADVVLNVYRPDAAIVTENGFSQEDVLDLVKHLDKGYCVCAVEFLWMAWTTKLLEWMAANLRCQHRSEF
jgi:crotonobetainyl-CoA:carnitine CoA-transferase CaiB-like acyl-CoA transferase